MLLIPGESEMLSVLECSGHNIQAALEYSRAGVIVDEFAVMVSEADGQLDKALNDNLDDDIKENENASYPSTECTGKECDAVKRAVRDKIDVFWSLKTVFDEDFTERLMQPGSPLYILTMIINKNSSLPKKLGRTQLRTKTSVSLQQHLEVMIFSQKHSSTFGANRLCSLLTRDLRSTPHGARVKRKESSLKTVRHVIFSQIQSNVKKISSDMLCKIKANDGELVMFKARIAHHANGGRQRITLKINFWLCSLTGIRVFLSCA